MTDRELLRRIERSAGQRAGYKQLVRELGLGGGRERRMLVEQLNRLAARGELIRPDRDHWALPQAAARNNLLSGRLDVHRDGFGFVRPEARQAGGDDDIFIPPNEMNGAMQGDQVLVELAPPRPDGRRSGRIARVLSRRNPTVVGIFRYARQEHSAGNTVTPLDERVTQAASTERPRTLAPGRLGCPRKLSGPGPAAASRPFGEPKCQTPALSSNRHRRRLDIRTNLGSNR